MDDEIYDDSWPDVKHAKEETDEGAATSWGEGPAPEPLAEEQPGAEQPGPDDMPSHDEREFVETLAEPSELESIAAGLETGPLFGDGLQDEPEAAAKTSHLSEDAVLLGITGEEPGSPEIVAMDGSVLAAPQAGADELLPPVDLGPEKRGNAWIWVGFLLGFLIMAGALGYAWWYFNERPIETPNVIGRLPAQAAQALNDAGLRLGRVTEQPTDTAPPGTVIEQSPKPDTKRKPGDAVALVVAGSPQTSKVPEVRGVSLDEASRVLANARLSARIVESYSPTTAVGFVQSQAPTAGAEVEPGSVVALMVSKGTQPASYRVPKVIGMNEADAAALLSTAEVRTKVYRSFDNSIPAGVVVAQTPLAGTQVVWDGIIEYLVCKGSGTNGVTVPDVGGMAGDKAVKKLKGADLKAEISYQVSADVPKGQVITQMPEARTKAPAGETVGLVVSAGPSSSVKVPSVTGMTADEASKKLAALGYRVVRIEVRTTSKAAGKVYMQLPAPGVLWPARYPVALMLASP